MTGSATLRIAYCITSYGTGEQLLRLTRLLRRAEPSSPVVIHHDIFASPLDTATFTDIPDVHVLTPDKPIVWGDMTMEAARWRLFRWVLEHLDVDWVVVLSEQDYPIAPLTRLRSRIAETGVDGFVSAAPMHELDDELRDECDKRYFYQYRNLPSTGLERRLPEVVQRLTWRARNLVLEAMNKVQGRVRFYTTPRALKLPTRIGIRAARSPFSASFPCWYNDCWFALSRKALERFIDYVDAHPDYGRYYERTVIPIESATATVLFNDPGLQMESSGLHAIRWTQATSGRPDVLTVDDLPFLRQSDAIFARKFDIRAPDVLDQLDLIVLAPDKETS